MDDRFIARFWSKVDRGGPDDCWEWQAGCANSGYGELQRGRRGEGMTTAHRSSYEIHHGPIPTGLCVMHSCDNRKCVNPAHLSLGTLADNNRDMWAKGRGRSVPQRGEASGNAKLTDGAVLSIRARRAGGEKLRPLALEFGVTETLISYIANRRIWKHLP